MCSSGSATAPRFSVVVPAYNADDTLGETLDAVSSQVYDLWECIVVDDGSTDDTLEIAQSYARRDSRFRVISQENRGTGGAYNSGVSDAAGAWIGICSADDILLPQHLKVMARTTDAHPDCDILSCNGYYLRPNGSRVLVYAGDSGRTSRSWSLEEVLEKCFFSVGACYRRVLFDSMGGYSEQVYGEDYDFWLRAMAAGARHLYIPDVLAVHRVSVAQKSANVIRAYESDIQSIAGVLMSGALSRESRRAAKAGIRMRRRLIAKERLHSLRTRVRSLVGAG